MRIPDFQQNGFDGYNITVEGQVVGTWVNSDNETPERVSEIMDYLERNMSVAPVLPPLPTLVTKGQLIRALYMLYQRTAEELDATVNAVIDNLPEGYDKTAYRYLWQYSTDVDLANPQALQLISAVALIFGLTQQQVEDGIRLAATL